MSENENEQYDNTNRGALFRNDKKTSEKSPEYTGSVNVGGVEYKLSAWVKVSKKGVKFFSLSAQPKEMLAASKPETKDDDLPF